MSMSEAERWGKLQALFRELADASAAERLARLTALTQEDPALAAQLRELLDADARATQSQGLPSRVSGAVQALAGELDWDREQPAWIGDYRVVSTLGSGGMGIVYLAEQESPRRTVALKVIRAFGGATAVRRFQRESELLGRLQHPGIALIHEAGMAAERNANGAPCGPTRPYFAMEHVAGEPVNDYAQRHNLSVTQRAELVARICDAVEHAHSRGVIHRDLKSANILVDATGAPKVLDFGIARAVNRDAATTLHTAVGEVVGTLPYMSPEQVAGDTHAVGIRSDVYALGVVLFEVLTGRRPLELAGRTLPEAVRIVTDEEPTRLGSVDRTLRGDLETIVARCLEKEPQRRYPSAGALAEDLRRYTAHRPIVARPASTLYQVSKFARRNRPLVIAVCCAFVALTAATAISVTLAVQAERARVEAEAQLRASRIENARSTQSFAFLRNLLTAADPTRSSGKEQTVRELVLQAADALQEGTTEDNQVTGMLARVVGYTLYRLGDLDAAERTMKRGVALLRDPDAAAVGVNKALVDSLVDLGDLLRARDKNDEAAAILAEAVTLRRADLRAAYAAQGKQVKDEDMADVALATALGNLSLVHQHRGDFVAAEQCAREAYELLRYMVSIGWNQRASMAIQLVNMASAQLLQGHAREAEPSLREALAIHEEVSGKDAPITLTARNNLAAALRALGRYDEAVTLLQAVITTRQRILPADHFETAMSRINIARVLAGAGFPARALQPARDAVAANERGLGPTHQDTVRARIVLAAVLDALGDGEAAHTAAATALPDLQKLLGSEHIRTAEALVAMSAIERHRGDAAAADRCAQEARQIAEHLQGPNHPVTFQARREIALAALAANDAAEGARQFNALAADLHTALGEMHPARGEALLCCAEAEFFAGDHASARANARAAAAILEQPGGMAGWYGRYATLLAECAADDALRAQSAWRARLADVRREAAEAGGEHSTELARIDRLAAATPAQESAPANAADGLRTK